jgi:hypothetical protein
MVTAAAEFRSMRRQLFGAIVLILVQSGLGMFVNLFVSIPRRHSGAQPHNYVTGSLKSLAWAFDHGALPLVIHTVLGALLAVMVVGIVAGSLRLPRRSLGLWSILGALLTVGAGFNGASFLDYNRNASSFVMAILAFGALACFLVVMYALPERSVTEATA